MPFGDPPMGQFRAAIPSYHYGSNYAISKDEVVKLSLQMLRSIVLSACISSCFAVTCYDCNSSGANHGKCTKEKNCSGLACVLYDSGDDRKTMSAFCLLAMKEKKVSKTESCWLDPDGRGRHCICYSNYCNHLIDNPLLLRTHSLSKNPFVDYDERLQKVADSDSDKSRSEEDLHQKIEIAYLRIEGNPDEDDLVPVDFSEYDRMLEKEITSSSSRPPSLMMMTLTLATTLARFISYSI
ncbi:hypothetical protein KIN20_022101 [Parelaphostrongylus tenuis]|uniref:Uncharacterized protein n=1 Tax=Parelaphostrongylus tenuis TaxID=148309 RepID=A0AAD5QS07_PARTN|nr:hypothetical protein KIN20_022101 [Parelaphostrongylus tenuis]